MIKKAKEKGVAIIGPATVGHVINDVNSLKTVSFFRLVESSLDVSRLEIQEG